MQVDRDFIWYANVSVTQIASWGWLIWSGIHQGDPWYWKFVTFIFVDMYRTCKPWASYPERTYMKNPDSFCSWLVANGLNYTVQHIPSEFDEWYLSVAKKVTPSGAISKKYPARISDRRSVPQTFVRSCFLKSVACFKNQFDYHGRTAPDIGFCSRGYWFTEAAAYGMWYYNYFIMQSMFWYLQNTTPVWCLPNPYCERWSYSPTAPDDVIVTWYNAVLYDGASSVDIRFKCTGDPGSPTPGDPDALTAVFGVQGLDSGGDPTGPWSFVDLGPVGDVWRVCSASFACGPGTVALYFGFIFNNGNGDYLLWFQNSVVKDPAGVLQLKVYGASGDSFGWSVIQGLFSFYDFCNA